MVKFVVEVSDGYIRERADVDNLEKLMKGFFADFVVFSCIEKKVEDDGVTEFNIKFDKDADEREIKVLNNAIATLATVALKQKIDSRVTE